MNRCRHCGAAIEWRVTKAGKRMPVEGAVITIGVPTKLIRELPRRTVVTHDGDTCTGHDIDALTRLIDCPAFVVANGKQPHWASCPGAHTARKGKKASKR